MEPVSSKVDLAWIFLFLFLSLLFSFLNEMSCWISEQCDVLAGVVELVLRLTIAKEKIELSVPISSPMHARTCVCVSDYSEWLVFGVFMCASTLFPPCCSCACRAAECCREGTQLWHNNVPHVEWPTYRGTQWVSRLTGLVVCCRVREWAYCKESRPRSSVCLCVSPQMLSCVLAAVCLPWVFEETCLLFWPSAF